MEHGNLNYSENANSDLGAVMRSVVWKPSPLIRWKRVEIEYKHKTKLNNK